jgi:hypothetical protein
MLQRLNPSPLLASRRSARPACGSASKSSAVCFRFRFLIIQAALRSSWPSVAVAYRPLATLPSPSLIVGSLPIMRQSTACPHRYCSLFLFTSSIQPWVVGRLARNLAEWGIPPCTSLLFLCDGRLNRIHQPAMPKPLPRSTHPITTSPQLKLAAHSCEFTTLFAPLFAPISISPWS